MDARTYLAKSFEGLSFENLRAMLEPLTNPMFWLAVAVGVVALTIAIISGLQNSPSGRDSAR